MANARLAFLAKLQKALFAHLRSFFAKAKEAGESGDAHKACDEGTKDSGSVPQERMGAGNPLRERSGDIDRCVACLVE